MKSIIVVADEKLRDHAINLVHAISKIEDMKASYFTPSKFRDNESEITGKNLTIFIGENDIAQPYLGVIKKNITSMVSTGVLMARKLVLWLMR